MHQEAPVMNLVYEKKRFAHYSISWFYAGLRDIWACCEAKRRVQILMLEKSFQASERCRGSAAVFIHKRYPTTNQRGSFCLLCCQPVPVHSSLINLFSNDYSKLSILTSALVRTPDRHAHSSGAEFPTHAHPNPSSSASDYAYKDTPRSPAEITSVLNIIYF